MKRTWAFPGTGRRLMRALGCGVGAVLLMAAGVPEGNDGAVVSFSVVPISGQALVVIGVDGAVTVRDFALTGPDRIVVDITGATLGVKKGVYDRIARGGVLDIRYAQNQPGVVRVVLTLAGSKRYQVTREPHEIRITVEGGDTFTAWRVGRPGMPSPALAKVTPSGEVTTVSNAGHKDGATRMVGVSTSPSASKGPVQQQPSQQPRISIAWESAPLTDVIAAFANFSGRTILASRGVQGNVTAEIINQPWDVAFKAILNANGYDAVEDANGIIIVSDIASVAARPRFEPLITRTIRLNYTTAEAVANALRERLTRDCGQQVGGEAGAPAAQAAQAQAAQTAVQMRAASGISTPQGTVDLRCPQRGAVTSDPLSNSVSITDAASSMEDMLAYARTLDQRQPQVNIKAKIILVDRTQLEALGLKYDLGTRQQHFNDVIARRDSTGAVESGNVIALGGNAISAIANAATGVPNATLRIIYSAAIGAFDFTTFLDALTESSLLDVQAEPSITTLSGRTAVLSAGTQVPVRTIEPGTGGNAGGAFPQVTVEMRQTGIVLNVTPSVTNNRHVLMRIHAENSDVQFQGGDIGAVFPTQSLDNEVLVADGETAVMGGLTQTSVRVTKSGIPFLVDLPLIGRLFGVTNRAETKRDLLILITPHIIDEGDMTMEPRRTP
jgi:type IV pilus assembly protein PilQ